MEIKELKDYLDFKAEQYERPEFIESDPIQLCHQFKTKEDIEIMGLLIATIAWGNRKSIINNGRKLMTIMSNAPHDFILNYTTNEDLKFVHRTFNSIDLDFFFRALHGIYSSGSNLEKCFASEKVNSNSKERIITFRQIFNSYDHDARSMKHISNPASNSAAKRLNMYLRWMVRKNNRGVDFGIWHSIPQHELMLPLDVHTGTISRELGILSRKQDDWKALEEIMTTLRALDPIDPVKYDFALFGIGAFEKDRITT